MVTWLTQWKSCVPTELRNKLIKSTSTCNLVYSCEKTLRDKAIRSYINIIHT